MHITKTDYLEYTYCRKNLWLKKHKPEFFDGVELSEFDKKIIREGDDADEAARNLFKDGVLVEIVGENAVPITQQFIEQKKPTIFQAAFLQDNFFVQVDVLRFNDTLGGWELYEVKASNDVKREIPHHHVNDVAFQKNVVEGCGLEVVKAGVIHLNGEYRKHGDVDYHELFIVDDLTDEIIAAQEEVRQQMDDVKSYLSMSEEKGCECLSRGRNNHCSMFEYSNPDVPEYSVHDINRIGGSKKLFYDWIDRGIYSLDDIDNSENLKGMKRAQYDAYVLGKPLIDRKKMKSLLGALEFPLYFFDYEGYSSAIPRFDGFGAYEQVPFQYSLHILHEDGRLDHREYLIIEPTQDLTLGLVKRMREDIGDEGNVISWYCSYEAQRNDKLAELHPEYAIFLMDVNDRMFDLMTIFSKGYYVDARFKGSASIKNVLPVIVPDLSYKALGVQKGDEAVERWEKMIDDSTPQEEKDKIAKDLLEYCKLDTLAMVEIYRFLRMI